jgi:uncharacterized NAD-dependent epimerase/dehydratase family protein
LKNKDIIIVGSQSGTVAYDTGNISQFTVPQNNFLMGTQPDAVVLCVNPFDETDYIKRTIQYIESSIDCKVIALTVFPMDIKESSNEIYSLKKAITDEKYKELRNLLQENFKISVYKLGEAEDMDKLSDLIVNFFE